MQRVMKEDSRLLVSELLTYMRKEELAYMIGKGYYSIDKWSKGKTIPCLGDYELMKTILRNRKWLKEAKHDARTDHSGETIL